MSLLKGLVESLARDGEINHEFEVKGMKFVLRSMSLEEQSLAESMVDVRYLERKYETKDLFVMRDTVERHRVLSRFAMSVKTVNGESPVNEDMTNHEKYKAREELRDELLQLPPALIDRMIDGFNKLVQKETEFYKDPQDVTEK